jgi:hypothetical protein
MLESRPKIQRETSGINELSLVKPSNPAHCDVTNRRPSSAKTFSQAAHSFSDSHVARALMSHSPLAINQPLR